MLFAIGGVWMIFGLSALAIQYFRDYSLAFCKESDKRNYVSRHKTVNINDISGNAVTNVCIVYPLNVT